MGNGTSIGRVRGLGAAREGAHHWLLQRFTAVGNLVLGLYFVFSMILLPDMQYATVTNWLGAPVPAMAVALMIVSVFWHARLGLQVLIEDYIHTAGNKFAAILALNLFVVAGIVAGLFFILAIVTQATGERIADSSTQAAIQQIMQQMGGGMGQ